MKLNTKALDAAIKTVIGVTGSGDIQIQCKGDFSVMSVNEGKYARISLGKADGKWKTRLMSGPLLEMLKGSADVELNMKDESSLSVKVKNTGAIIKCMPFEPVPEIDRKGGSKITEKNQAEIRHALETVGITDIHEDGNSNFIFLKMDKERMVVSRFDSYHMAYFETKDVKGKEKIEVTAAAESFDTISRVAGTQGYSFSMTDSIRAWNDEFEIQLPLVQSENQQKLESVQSLISGLKSSKGEFTLNKEDLFTALEKCAAVHENGSSVGVSAGSNKITLSIKTSYGQVDTKIEAKTRGTIDFRLDPHLVSDTLRPVKAKEVQIKVNDNLAFAKVKDEGRTAFYAFVLVTAKKESKKEEKKAKKK